MSAQPPSHPRRYSRRDFLRVSSAGGSAALVGAGALPRILDPGSSQGMHHGHATTGRRVPLGLAPDVPRSPLRRAPEVSPQGLKLVAAPGKADIGAGIEADGWLLNGSLPSPLIRVKKGDPFDVVLDNQITDPLILHWHGLTPPERADGHPRFAIGQQAIYPYRFTVENRASTYWYHSHSHMRVGKHTQMGIAGMLIVEDDEEALLGLPTGEREVPIVLQDRLLDENGQPVYANPNTMEGHAGDEPFGNGIRRPYLDVDTALYRFRLLNGANSRIFRLELSDGRPLVVIGNDGGLLERPVPVSSLDLAPGERVDLLVDLSGASVGDRIMLRSAEYQMPGRLGELDVQGLNLHGTPLDLLELRVERRVSEEARIPEVLSTTLHRPDPADAVRERRFQLSFKRDYWTRATDQHFINGKKYEMERIDEKVPFDQTEIWTFTNDNYYPHPMHLHATHFRVVSREGGRGRVMPWEGGLKDTVLVYPNETVRIAVRFNAHRGLFVLHCHNLEHEDVGMMQNILVE